MTTKHPELKYLTFFNILFLYQTLLTSLKIDESGGARMSGHPELTFPFNRLNGSIDSENKLLCSPRRRPDTIKPSDTNLRQ